MVNTKKSLSTNVVARLGVLSALITFAMIIGMTMFVGVPNAYATSSAETQVMYRLYNPNSGEHFYTASEYERDRVCAAGWNYEGIGWTAPVKSDTPVYRLYSGTDHHYTTSAAECDMLMNAGWSYEGISWYSDDAQRVPLYRQFNPNVNPSAMYNNSGSHNYTTSKAENDYLVSVGWREEGIGWYGATDGTEFASNAGASGADGTGGSADGTQTGGSADGTDGSTGGTGNTDGTGGAGDSAGGTGGSTGGSTGGTDGTDGSTGGTGGAGDSTGSTGGSDSTGTTHVHNFSIPIIGTVHHSAAYKSVIICDLCGTDITNADSANHSNYHRSLGEICTMHVQSVLVTPAYDEEVVTGYKCSCGAVQ